MGRTESPNLKNDYERACGWYGHFNESEMALFSECTDRYARKILDTADIVREAILRQLPQRNARTRAHLIAGQRHERSRTVGQQSPPVRKQALTQPQSLVGRIVNLVVTTNDQLIWERL